MARTIRTKGHLALCGALVDARKDAGLTQDDLAKRLKCQQSLVARLEGGQRRIDVVELVVLARAIGFSLSDVMAIVDAATEPDHRI